MSTQVKYRRDTFASVAAFTGAQGELIIDTTNRRLTVHDGVTPGGVPANGAYGPNGSGLQLNTLEGVIETITPGALTHTSSLVIPARAMVLGVSHRVISAITGCTAFEIGVSGNPGQFATGLGVSAGSNNAGIGGPNSFYSATPLLLTSTAGGNFTGGTIRLSVQYLTVVAPAS
jgi:hypothetical protein